MKKNGKRSRLIKSTLIIIILLIVLIAILSVIEYYPNALVSLTEKPKLYVIQDRCSIILDRLIHQIKDEGECRIACRNECGVRNEQFESSEFIEKENACHICNCYCK